MTLLEALKALQANALEKLKARETLKASGNIFLRLKLAKNLLLGPGSKPSLTLEISKEATGLALASAIAERLDGVSPLDLRLISSGKVLADNSLLVEMGVKPGAVIMVVKINKDDDSLQVLNEQRKMLQDTRNDAELLGDDDGGRHGLQLTGTTEK